MLERGHAVFDCQVVELLLENDVYQSYLLNCSDSTLAKLFLLRPDSLSDRQQQSFFDQASSLSSQSFPNVASLIKVDTLNGTAACLYPVASGVQLAEILEAGCSVQQAVKFTKIIAERLSAPHRANLCHGNLSPKTIYFAGDIPTLADFSLGQLFRLDYKSGIDPHYTSPEQVRGETLGTASDIYNLGCIFYYLLTGQPPFSGTDPFTIAKQHLEGEFPKVPEELAIYQPLLDSLIAAEAEERIVIDEFINQIGQLPDYQGNDKCHFSVPVDGSKSTEKLSSDGSFLLDEEKDGSEIAARIEERLSAYAGIAQEFEPDEQQTTQGGDAIDRLDSVGQQKIGFWRFIVILLFGVLIGSGLYFLFYKQSPVPPSVVVESEVDLGSGVAVDLDKGLKLWQEGDLNGAEDEFKQVIQQQPDDPRSYNNLAAFYAAQGNYAQARDYLEQALATDEEYAAIYHNLGSVYAEMARGSYGRALQLDQKKALLALPVFSSQGVINLASGHGETEVQHKSVSEKELDSAVPSKAEKPPATAEIVNVAPAKTPEPASQMETVEKLVPVGGTSAEEGIDTAIAEQHVEKQPSPSVTAIVEAEKGDHFLLRWAKAWSNQDIEGYLAFYSDQFIPSGGKTRHAWEAQRRSRLAKPANIKVTLENFKLIPQTNGNLTVEVVQKYHSDLLTDRTQKIFDLQPTETGWKILRERSLGAIR